MWKIFTGISLTLCAFAMADESPPKSSVSVDCCGRVRHGVVAVGCETTGTTITFNRIVWELQLNDEAARNFAKKHHKETVVVTGKLRKVAATETKVRWIVDVESMSERDPAKDEEGTRLTISGTLRATDHRGAASGMIIDADDEIWPISASADAKEEVNPQSLVGQTVLAKGSVERVSESEENFSSALMIRFNTLQRGPKASEIGERGTLVP